AGAGASSGWQNMGATGGGAAGPAAAAAGDDFSRFVVDDRTAGGGRGGMAGSRSKGGSRADLTALEAGAAGVEKPAATAAAAPPAASGSPAAAAVGPDGRVLGMFKDKDETADSLRAGLPVVSISLGDSADFLYGRTREAEAADSVRLESGDVLVFGGPGRMIFHSVARVLPHTAPKQLLDATGLRPGRLNLTFRQYRAG
ncbi:Alpha-ketoglutarate-dependent dioxygenase AlkB, partial [Tetrabaena socialis]